jgi:hypothetical protein
MQNNATQQKKTTQNTDTSWNVFNKPEGLEPLMGDNNKILLEVIMGPFILSSQKAIQHSSKRKYPRKTKQKQKKI